jgi:hypothetical protein
MSLFISQGAKSGFKYGNPSQVYATNVVSTSPLIDKGSLPFYIKFCKYIQRRYLLESILCLNNHEFTLV